MIKYLLSLLLLISLTASAQEPKFLHYQFNEAVVITISNVDCPFPQLKTEYTKAAAAFRVDGQKLAGCFKKQDEDLIAIQWYKGDVTVIPANAFLQNGTPAGQSDAPKPKAKIEM